MLKKYNSNAVTVSSTLLLVGWPLSKLIWVLKVSQVRFCMTFVLLALLSYVTSFLYHFMLLSAWLLSDSGCPSMHGRVCVHGAYGAICFTAPSPKTALSVREPRVVMSMRLTSLSTIVKVVCLAKIKCPDIMVHIFHAWSLFPYFKVPLYSGGVAQNRALEWDGSFV